MIGAIPFVIAMLFMVGLLIVFPSLAVFLPELAFPLSRGEDPWTAGYAAGIRRGPHARGLA